MTRRSESSEGAAKVLPEAGAGVNYDSLVAVLIEAAKAQFTRQQDKSAKLEARLADVEARSARE